MDIYYSQESMEKWKKNCVEAQGNMKAKLDKYEGAVKTMKKKLKSEKDKSVKNTQNQKEEILKNLFTVIREYEGKVQSLMVKSFQCKCGRDRSEIYLG